MKKIIAILILFVTNIIKAQNPPTPDLINCVNQPPYTITTDPNDNSQYVFTPNTFNYNINPNGLNGPAHFDWVNTQILNCVTKPNQLVPNAQLISPFYCNGINPIQGSCTDNNLRIYNDIKQDPFNQYPLSTDKLKAMDVLPEDGWELIKYSLGRVKNPNNINDLGSPQANPYIWLYNRYTGKMKFFIALTSETGKKFASFTPQSKMYIPCGKTCIL